MDLDKTIAANVPAPQEDRLEALRSAVRVMRDLDLEIKELEERVSDRKGKLLKMKHETLVEQFEQLGINILGIEPDGNMPGFDAELKPYYKANISAEWPPERQAAAYQWLEKSGFGDMIKTQIVVELGRGERKLAKRVEKGLAKIGVPFSTKLGVPWNTLTSWLKERIEKHKETPPLDLLGAQAGKVVNLKIQKQAKGK